MEYNAIDAMRRFTEERDDEVVGYYITLSTATTTTTPIVYVAPTILQKTGGVNPDG